MVGKGQAGSNPSYNADFCLPPIILAKSFGKTSGNALSNNHVDRLRRKVYIRQASYSRLAKVKHFVPPTSLTFAIPNQFACLIINRLEDLVSLVMNVTGRACSGESFIFLQ